MPQPFFSPRAFSYSPTVAQSSVSLQDVPRYTGRNGDDYYYFNAVRGLPTADRLNIMVNAFGLDKLAFGDEMKWIIDRMIPVSGYTVRRSLGSELKPRGLVVSCSTANGSGLGSITLDITFDGGTGGAFFSQGHELISPSGRNFEITENPTIVNGVQRAIIAPRDGVSNLVVAGGQSQDFPNQSTFGHLAVNKLPARCGQVFNDYVSTPSEYEACRLSRTFFRTARDMTTLQNQILYGNVAAVKINGSEEGQDNAVGLFLLNAEIRSAVKAMTDFYSAFWWGQANNNNTLQSMAGDGVYYSINPELRQVIPPSAYNTPQTLERMLDWFYDLNPTSKETPPVFFQGFDANKATNKTLDAANTRQMFEAPYKDKEAGQGYWYNEPTFSGYRNFAGYSVIFKHSQAFDSTTIGSDLSPASQNRGIRSFSTIGLDMGHLQNIDMSTLQYKPEDGPGSWKVNSYCAKNLLTNTEDFHVDRYLRGAVSELGENLQTGEVGGAGFDDIVTREQVFTFGVEVTPNAGISLEIGA